MYWHIRKAKDARRLLDKIAGTALVPQTPMEVKATILRGWIDMTVPPKSKTEVDLRSNSVSHSESVKE